MFKKQTVFVLGAGASVDYGFPDGQELKKQIVQVLDDSELEKALPAQNIQRGIFHTKKEKLKSGLSNLATYGLGNIASIDDFLDKNPGDNILAQIAKICIAGIILKLEKEGADRRKIGQSNYDYGREPTYFYFPGRPRAIGRPGKTETYDWYSILWQIMIEGYGSEKFDDIFDSTKNKLSFVSFNYDRSLEQYLFYAAQETFGRSAREVYSSLKYLNVYHVYGRVGNLFYPDESGQVINLPEKKATVYGFSEQGASWLDSISIYEQIRTYTEAGASDEHSKIKQLISEAEKIYLIGFGYHRLNLKLLFPDVVSERSKQILGTGLDVSRANRDVLQSKIGEAFNATVTIEDVDAYTLMRDFRLDIEDWDFVDRL